MTDTTTPNTVGEDKKTIEYKSQTSSIERTNTLIFPHLYQLPQ
jgi:hypothetical protein